MTSLKRIQIQFILSIEKQIVPLQLFDSRLSRSPCVCFERNHKSVKKLPKQTELKHVGPVDMVFRKYFYFSKVTNLKTFLNLWNYGFAKLFSKTILHFSLKDGQVCDTSAPFIAFFGGGLHSLH